MSEGGSDNGKHPQEEQFMLMTKEINRYLLRFHDKKLESEYFQNSVYKYKQLGYTICVILVVIVISDFVNLFEASVFPQKKLIYLVSILTAAIVIFVFLHFKESWFNITYSIFYGVYITLTGWYMYDSDLYQGDLKTGSDTSFTRGYAISAILVLGITGSNYLLKNIMFLYGTILIYIAQGIQHGVSFEIIVRVVLVLALYFYVSHHREYAHRRSYLRQKQIDQYNNIMNNQIPHCLFAAKFNSAEQRIELFKCNARAQKEFGVNGNEDFDHFITNTFMISTQDKQDIESSPKQQFGFESNNNNNQTKLQQQVLRAGGGGEQTWENSLKGQIRQLIDLKVHENHELSYSSKQLTSNSATRSKSQSAQNNLNIRSPIFKLKLRMQEGADAENKISVQLSLFKLHEYYIIITVDKWKKKKKTGNKSKSQRSTMQQSQKPAGNEWTPNMNGQQIPHKNLQNQQHHHTQQQVEDIESRGQQQNSPQIQMTFPSPPAGVQTHTGISSEEDQALFTLNQQTLRNTAASIAYATMQGAAMIQTPPNVSSTRINLKTSIIGGQDTPKRLSSITPVGLSQASIIPLVTPTSAVHQGTKALLKTKQIVSNNNQLVSANSQFQNLMQKKLSLSAIRKPVGSVYSIASASLPYQNAADTTSNTFNQPRTVSIGFDCMNSLQHQRISLVSRQNTQQYQPQSTIQQENNENSNSQSLQSCIGNNFMNTQQTIQTNGAPPSQEKAGYSKTIQSSNSKSLLKEQMFEASFEIIQQTMNLIKRYKEKYQLFKDGLVNTTLLSRKEDLLEQYTMSMMQEILIVNSNYIRLHVLQIDSLQLQFSSFKLVSLAQYLQQHLQPLLLDRNISLYLQDESELSNQDIVSDEYALRISLVNIIVYISQQLPANAFVSVKFTLLSDTSGSNTLKIQISSPLFEDAIFKEMDKLMGHLPEDIQKEGQRLKRFHIDLRVAFNLIKKINQNNPQTNEYLLFTPPMNKQQNMHLTISIPTQHVTSSKSQENRSISSNSCAGNSLENEQKGMANSPQPQEEDGKQLQTQRFTQMQLTSRSTNNNHNYTQSANILSNPTTTLLLSEEDQNDFENNKNNNHDKENNECNSSFTSLDRWIAFKQYTSRISEKPIKLIL